MSIMVQMRELARLGRQGEAVALVAQSAEAGDGEACFVLANWRLWGLYGLRDLEACHLLLERAASASFNEAARLRAYLVANGTGGSADFAQGVALLQAIASVDENARTQIAMLEEMPLPEEVGGLERETLSPDPSITLIRGLLTPNECGYLIAQAAPMLRPSLVVDPITRRSRPDPTRTSSGMNFDPSTEDLVVNAINRRLAAVTASPFECGENLSILRYEPGQEYVPHVDALPAVANQRHITALVYLNEDYTGGETSFVSLGIEVKGSVGDCLIFHNSGADGRPDMRTRHAGQPVTSGVKWLASRWIRQMPYDRFATG
ncbi:MAG TPA: 2OG-Fe(II) oxygenase [Allosphingosinicella sp.]|jgi:prolyl 4-hydroxylase